MDGWMDVCVRVSCIPVVALCIRLDLVLDHVDHDLVTDQTAGVHDLLRFPTQSRLLRDLFSQHIARCLSSVVRIAFTSLGRGTRTRWHIQYLSLILGACVPLPSSSIISQKKPRFYQATCPLPAPGGPIRIIRIEVVEPSRPDNFFSKSSTLPSSFVMMRLSSSTTELSVGAIAGLQERRLPSTDMRGIN
jgi:hypothetical protein